MEEMQNTTEWVRANNYTEGSSIYSQENEVTDNNNRIEASISIDGDVLKKYVNDVIDNDKTDIIDAVRDAAVDEVHDSVMDQLDYHKIAEYTLDDFDYDSVARTVYDEYIDIDDIVEKVNMELDYSDIASTVYGYIDMSEVASEVEQEIDIESTALSLLNQYKPGNGCSLGTAFTACISDALRYFVETNDSVIDLIKNYDSTVSNDDVEVNTVESQATVNDAIVTENTDSPIVANQSISDDDNMYIVLKRIVNELLSSYVPTFNTDPFMRIRMEAKAFDMYNEMKG